jgi:hypothetical protein
MGGIMKRRRFVQTLAVFPAAPALIAQTPLESSVPDVAAEPVPHFFSGAQLAALRRLSDIIVPAIGDTPGALDARTPEFLDFLIGDSPAPRQQLYRTGLDGLNSASRKKYGQAFAELQPAQADEVIAPLREAWTYDPPSDPVAAFLRAAKADILMATTNSREWIAVVSKRNRGAGGVGSYWLPID